MMVVTFSTFGQREQRTLGPFGRCFARGCELFGDGNQRLAVHANGTWELDDGSSFVRFAFDKGVKLSVRNGHPQGRLVVGTFRGVRMVDGSIYGNQFVESLLLKLSDITDRWLRYDDGQEYDEVHFDPVA